MKILRPRNRLVNFRLTEAEFNKLKASCALHGSRSISDFARSSVLDRMETAPNSQFGNQGRLLHLDHKVTELEHRLGQLLVALQTNPAAPPIPPHPALFEQVAAARAGSGD